MSEDLLPHVDSDVNAELDAQQQQYVLEFRTVPAAITLPIHAYPKRTFENLKNDMMINVKKRLFHA